MARRGLQRGPNRRALDVLDTLQPSKADAKRTNSGAETKAPWAREISSCSEKRKPPPYVRNSATVSANATKRASLALTIAKRWLIECASASPKTLMKQASSPAIVSESECRKRAELHLRVVEQDLVIDRVPDRLPARFDNIVGSADRSPNRGPISRFDQHSSLRFRPLLRIEDANLVIL